MNRHFFDNKFAISFSITLLILTSWLSVSGTASSGEAFPHKTPARAVAAKSPEADREMKARIVESYGKLPMRFEANEGQADSRFDFLSRGEGYSLLVSSDEAVFAISHPSSASAASEKRVSLLRMKLVGASDLSRPEGLDLLPGTSNYFIGRDEKKWRTSIPNYRRVLYKQVYEGIDLIYYGNGKQLEYDFIVAPGASSRAIRLEFKGARRMRVDASGDLLLSTGAGEMRQRRPVAYQEIEGTRRDVDARYVIRGRNRVGFEIGAHDAGKPLVIDPIFSYSTFLGGSSEDLARDIAVDSSGNAYVTGGTQSFNFPTTIDSFDATLSNNQDAFVTKMNASGTDIIYSTYLGDIRFEEGRGIAVDSSGNAYVTGQTGSINFPTTPGAFQTVKPSFEHNATPFVTKLNSAGTGLIYSTYLGGADQDVGLDIALDSSNNAYVAGNASSGFPTTPGAFQTVFGGGFGFQSGDAFIAKLNSTGTGLIYSTYLGGEDGDAANGIHVDAVGIAYVTGTTSSTDFDTTPGAFQTALGDEGESFQSGDAFITKLNNTGTGLIYSTYLGGLSIDEGRGIAVNLAGEAFVAGSSFSTNFATTPGTLRVMNGGVAKTVNAGASWAAMNSGLTATSVRAIVVNPASPSVVYLGTDQGVFKSTSGGGSWSPMNSGLVDMDIFSMAIDPVTTSTLYLGTETRGIFKSTDSGSSWRAINTGQNGSMVSAIAVNPEAPSTLYIATNMGVFKTVNGGASWTAASNGLPNSIIGALIIDHSSPLTLYAGSFNGVFKSTSGGSTWAQTGLNSAQVRSLAINPDLAFQVLAGTPNGFYVSVDSGQTWKPLNNGLTNRTINALAAQPGNPDVFYAATEGGLFKSTNGGASWNPLNGGLAGAQVNALAFHPTDVSTLYAGTSAGSGDAFITRLSSGGNSLVYSTLLGGEGHEEANAIALDSSGNAYVTGLTGSRNFPTTPGLLRTLASSFQNDAFVTKLNPSASGLVYSGYLGGFESDAGFGIRLDTNNSAYVVGRTSSSNYPVTAGAFQTLLNNGGGSFSGDGFITKMEPAPRLMADLGIQAEVSQEGNTPGSIITYDITVVNNGPEAVSGIRVINDLPSSLRVNSCNISFQIGFCSSNGPSTVFTLNRLEPGASANMTLSVRIDCFIPTNTFIQNVIRVESDAVDLNDSNNSFVSQFNALNLPASLNPPGQAFPSTGGSGSISVNRGVSCEWRSVSNDPWITVTFSSDCCTFGTVNYNVAPNPGPERMGTITIAGETFTVNQAGGPTGPYSVSGLVAAPPNLAIPGVTLTFTRINGSGAIPPPVSTDSSGNWSQSGFEPGSTYRVTPSKRRFTFSPAFLDFSGTSTTLNFTGSKNVDTTGVFRPSNGAIFLKNSNNSGFADLFLTYGIPGDRPVTGDWDGDGIDTIGVYRDGTFFLRNSNTNGFADIVATFGLPGDQPVVGDWNGDGIDTIGTYRNGVFLLRNSNTTGDPEIVFGLGNPGDIGIAGDWDGNGTVTTGVFRPSNGALFLKNSNSTGFAEIFLTYGLPGDKPMAGDWNGDGIDTIGVYRGGDFLLRNSNTNGFADIVFSLGIEGDEPIVGDWNGLP